MIQLKEILAQESFNVVLDDIGEVLTIKTLRVMTLSLLCTTLFFAAAQTNNPEAAAQAMTDAFLALTELTAFVDANVSFCAELAPATATSVKQASDAWYSSNGLGLMTQARNASPEMTANFVQLAETLKNTLLQDLKTRAVGREAEWCNNFPNLLQGQEWNVQLSYAAELNQLREFIALVTGSAPLPQTQALQPITSPSYAQVIAAGINPELQFIPDEFHCYDEDLIDYSQAHLIVQFPVAGQYVSSYGAGTYALEQDTNYSPDIEWLSGPLTDAGGFLSFDEFGQTFFLSRVELGEESFSFDCYQQGASKERALIEFRLKTPQLGAYQCRDAETGEAQSLELLAGNRYQIGGNIGTYALSELLESGSNSRIEWLSGPFLDEVSFYSEEEDTGYRDFSISVNTGGAAYPGFAYSSSELALTCEGIGEPVSFAKYGTEVAPPALGSDVAIDGFFYKLELSYNGTTPSYEPLFYRFFPNGYVFIGTPGAGEPSQIDCSRTRPNGMPFCAMYSVRANTLYLSDEGEQENYSFSLNAGIPILDDEQLIPVTANAVTSLNGLYWGNYFSQTGFCGPYSICSSTYLEWNYDLKPDGSFVYATSSQNLSSSDTALGSTNVSGFGNSSNTGSYTVGPHSIELRYNNGKVETFFMFIQDAETFIMGDRRFTLKEEDSQ